MSGYGRRLSMALALTASVAGSVLVGIGSMLRRLQRRATSFNGTLYHRPLSPTCQCLWLAEELGIRHSISVEVGTPSQDAPVEDVFISHDGLPIRDTIAICLYMSDACEELLPPSNSKSSYYSWSASAGAITDSILRPLTEQIYRVADEERDIDLVTSLSQRHGVYMDALDKHLSGRDYVCGNKFTAADVVLGYCVFWSAVIRGGQLLVNSPNVRSYLERLKVRKAFSKTMGSTREWLMTMMGR